jgi:hypothetical protein
MLITLLGGIVFFLSPVWFGLYLTWVEKEKKSLKELLVVWTRNCLIISSIFLVFGLPLIFQPMVRLPNVSYTPLFLIRNIVLLFLLGFSVYWVIGAVGTLFIWAIRKE